MDHTVVHCHEGCVGARKLVIFAKPDDLFPLSNLRLFPFCVPIFEVSYEPIRSEGVDERRFRRSTTELHALYLYTDKYILAIHFPSYHHLFRDGIGVNDGKIDRACRGVQFWNR